jgi:hypothetical protein
MQSYIPRKMIYLTVFQFYFLFCIAKGLGICKFRGDISIECCTFKLLNLYMLIPQHYYLFNFVLFYCFHVLNKHPINSIDFGLKAHLEKT